MRVTPNKVIFSVLAFLGMAAVFIWLTIFAKAESGLLEVHFLDVGQGKAIFIEEPGGSQILIDGGPDNSVLQKLSEEMPFYDRDIDLLILTHPDADHLNGLIEVLKRYSIGRIIETGITDPSANYGIWHNLIKEKNIPLVIARAGQEVKIGDGFLLAILFPGQNLAGQSFKNTNSSSIVARLVYGKNSFLFTGDAEEPTEAYLVGSGAMVDSDVLDVGHHGSKNSTSQEFVEAVSPQDAVIQVGAANRYGHPAQEALERLKGIKVLRTDLCGNITFFSDGQNFKEERGCD
ncbi:MAG: ComEC/Rec2 family competence protein [bacterium]